MLDCEQMVDVVPRPLVSGQVSETCQSRPSESACQSPQPQR